MSYCRFSDDDYGCDIYFYEAEDGLIIHVAGSRVVGDVPKLDWSEMAKGDHESIHRFLDQHQAQMDFLSTAKHKAIDLPFAGETFHEYSLSNCYQRLLYLREIGYNVPERVFDSLRDDMAGRK